MPVLVERVFGLDDRFESAFPFENFVGFALPVCD
jgi:hypothetical protein